MISSRLRNIYFSVMWKLDDQFHKITENHMEFTLGLG